MARFFLRVAASSRASASRLCHRRCFLRIIQTIPGSGEISTVRVLYCTVVFCSASVVHHTRISYIYFFLMFCVLYFVHTIKSNRCLLRGLGASWKLPTYFRTSGVQLFEQPGLVLVSCALSAFSPHPSVSPAVVSLILPTRSSCVCVCLNSRFRQLQLSRRSD